MLVPFLNPCWTRICLRRGRRGLAGLVYRGASYKPPLLVLSFPPISGLSLFTPVLSLSRCLCLLLLVDCVKLQKVSALLAWWLSYLGSLSVFPSGKWGLSCLLYMVLGKPVTHNTAKLPAHSRPSKEGSRCHSLCVFLLPLPPSLPSLSRPPLFPEELKILFPFPTPCLHPAPFLPLSVSLLNQEPQFAPCRIYRMP